MRRPITVKAGPSDLPTRTCRAEWSCEEHHKVMKRPLRALQLSFKKKHTCAESFGLVPLTANLTLLKQVPEQPDPISPGWVIVNNHSDRPSWEARSD